MVEEACGILGIRIRLVLLNHFYMRLVYKQFYATMHLHPSQSDCSDSSIVFMSVILICSKDDPPPSSVSFSKQTLIRYAIKFDNFRDFRD